MYKHKHYSNCPICGTQPTNDWFWGPDYDCGHFLAERVDWVMEIAPKSAEYIIVQTNYNYQGNNRKLYFAL